MSPKKLFTLLLVTLLFAAATISCTATNNSTTTSASSQVTDNTVFMAPTAAPAYLPETVTKLIAFMQSQHKGDISMWQVSPDGQVEFIVDARPTSDKQLAIDVGLAPTNQTDTVTQTLCFDNVTKILQEQFCPITLSKYEYTWVHGDSSWYYETLDRVTINLADIYTELPGNNGVYHIVASEAYQACRQINDDSGQHVFICFEPISFQMDPIQLSTHTPETFP